MRLQLDTNVGAVDQQQYVVFCVEYRSEGDIPKEFLRGAGALRIFIEFATSIADAEQPIGYYSCLISYSSKIVSEWADHEVRVTLAKERWTSGHGSAIVKRDSYNNCYFVTPSIRAAKSSKRGSVYAITVCKSS